MAIKLKNNYLLWLSAFLISASLIVFGLLFFRLNSLAQEKGAQWDLYLPVSYISMADKLAEDEESLLLPENVSEDYVQLYRDYYGSLDTQLGDISRQYTSKIKKAEDEQEVKKMKKERDAKFQAIIDNFSDDKIVREKIIDINKQWLKKHGDETEKTLAESVKEINRDYYYYITKNDGRVLMNTPSLKREKNQQKVEDFFEKKSGYPVYQQKMYTSFPWYELGINQEELTDYQFLDFGEEVSVTMGMKKNSPAMIQMKEVEKREQAIKICMFLCVIFLLIGFFAAYHYLKYTQKERLKYLAILKKVPLDVGIILSLGAGLLMAYTLSRIGFNRTLLSLGEIFLLWAVLMLWVTILIAAIKELSAVFRKEKWLGVKRLFRETLIAKTWRIICVYYQRLPFLVVLILILPGIFATLYIFENYFYRDFSSLPFRFLLMCLSIVSVKLLYRHQKFYKQTIYLTEQSQKLLTTHGAEVSPLGNLRGLEENVERLGLIIEQQEKSNQQNEGLKHELLTNVSHDLRTPLTSLITYSELLQKAENTPEEQEKYRKIISDKSLRMKRLIDDLFEVTKMSNGEVLLNKSTINLKQLLEQAIAEYEEIFKKKDLKLMYYKPHESIKAMADGDKIWRVMDNLFGNAAKYTMPGTRIHLKLQQKDDEILLEMKNIANYELNQEASGLVERFRRADNSRNTEGFGLGLAIANSIIELHQGTLQIIVDGDMFKILISLPA